MSIQSLKGCVERYLTTIEGDSNAPMPGIVVLRKEETTQLEGMIYNPLICVILQGRKETSVGDHTTSYGPGDAITVSHDLPVVSKITDATPETPYLALVLTLDLAVLRSLFDDVGAAARRTSDVHSLCVSAADPSWTEPIERYLACAQSRTEANVLGPVILREIHFRLLMSPMGGMLRNLLMTDSHADRIAKAILRIRSDFRAPLAVPDLARHVGMSQSSFHEHFKSVTGTTPLQYQKDLRMIEARTLLQGGRFSVAAAGYEVGYESATQFSREYARKFGASPRNDIGAMLASA